MADRLTDAWDRAGTRVGWACVNERVALDLGVGFAGIEELLWEYGCDKVRGVVINETPGPLLSVAVQTNSVLVAIPSLFHVPGLLGELRRHVGVLTAAPLRLFPRLPVEQPAGLVPLRLL